MNLYEFVNVTKCVGYIFVGYEFVSYEVVGYEFSANRLYVDEYQLLMVTISHRHRRGGYIVVRRRRTIFSPPAWRVIINCKVFLYIYKLIKSS